MLRNDSFSDEEFKNFAAKHGRQWRGIFDAKDLSKKNKDIIHKSFPESMSLFSSDVDLVVFGSIARGECTLHSDIDWTLLVDGQANPEHRNLVFIINKLLEKTKLSPPGTTGMFGQITFSHDLIHYIGGEEDTNHNITRRVLLLLESENFFNGEENKGGGTAYDRVGRAIIQQYIDSDSSFRSDRGKNLKVPRLLLNDIIRFWRTMCVDFAYKQREQDGKKWALRNIKLRMSRKLTYIKGLLMCFSCYKNEELDKNGIEEQLQKCISQKPLNFVLAILLQQGIKETNIVDLFDAYDAFLLLLNDSAKREHLERLHMLNVYDDVEFKNARKICDKFQKALNKIFIEEDSLIKEFTLKYCIF